MKILLFSIALSFLSFGLSAQTSSYSPADSSCSKSITIHFRYGSKPARGFKKTEQKYFGGIHGGHVYMEFDSVLFSFRPSANYHLHIFPHKKNKLSGYFLEDRAQFSKDTVGCKVTSITFILTDSEYIHLEKVKQNYLSGTPYDYAFFGMRCAAAAYDVLSQTGIFKMHCRFFDVMTNFYPQRLRRKVLRDAERNHLRVVRKSGRKSRKWEKDGLLEK